MVSYYKKELSYKYFIKATKRKSTHESGIHVYKKMPFNSVIVSLFIHPLMTYIKHRNKQISASDTEAA